MWPSVLTAGPYAITELRRELTSIMKPSNKQLRVFKVSLNSEADRAKFEQFMTTQVLQNTITFRDGHSSQDELYVQKSGSKDSASYIWLISRTPSINGEFSHNTDATTAFKSVKGKVEEFGSVTPL